MDQKKNKKQGWIYFLTCAITFCHINAYAFTLEQLFQAVDPDRDRRPDRDGRVLGDFHLRSGVRVPPPANIGEDGYFMSLIAPIWTNGTNLRILNTKDAQGNTLLHYASENGFVWGTEVLIRAGVDLLPENNEGLTPPQLALRRKNQYSEIVCLSLNVVSDCTNRLKDFRPSPVADPYLLVAWWRGYLRQIQILALFEPHLIPISRPITRPNTSVVTTEPELEPEFSPDPPRIIIPDEYVERPEPEERVPSDPPIPPTRIEEELIEDIEESVLTPLNFLEFNESRSGPIQFTDLETAIIAGQVDQVQSLLSQGSAPSLLNPTTGETPFDLAVYRVRLLMGQFCNAVNIRCTHQNIRQYVFDPTRDSVVYKDHIERTHNLYLRTYAIMELLE